MIKHFKDSATERLWNGESTKRFSGIRNQALRKLDMLNASAALRDLRVSAGNHLKQLAGDRKGQHSIRVNDQWRICFVWSSEGATQVEIVDYH